MFASVIGRSGVSARSSAGVTDSTRRSNHQSKHKRTRQSTRAPQPQPNQKSSGATPMPTPSVDTIRRLLRPAIQEGRTILLEHEAYAVLQAAGIATSPHRFVARGAKVPDDLPAALAGKEVVLKVVSPQIPHKTEAGGVRVAANDVAAIQSQMADMLRVVADKRPDAEIHGVLVVAKVDLQPQVPGSEFLLSFRRDSAFGPVLVFGMGGLLTEWYAGLSGGASRLLFSAHDFDAQHAMEALEATPFGQLALKPSRVYRKAPVERSALASALSALAALGALAPEGDEPWLEELEINPIVPSGGKLVALDALAKLAPPPSAPRPPRPIATIARLLHPRSAAVCGASNKSLNAGRIILRNLKQSEGIAYGHLYAVHPSAERIENIPCVRTIADLPETVDLAVVSIPAEQAGAAIQGLVDHGKARSIILIPGGFAETGRKQLAERIQATVQASRERADGGVILVGGNCLGIVSKDEYNTFFLPSYKLPFHAAPGSNLAAVSQSGAYLVSFTSNLDGVIFPRASISYGNEMDVTACDFFEYYLQHEPQARVLAFYVEGFQPGEGQRFLSLVRRARTAGHGVVVYKAGKTAGGAQAAASHTASMAGDYDIARALLTEAGALVCETLNMFEDATKALSMLEDREVTGRRVGVVTNAGFEAGAVSDHLYTLELAQFSAATRKALREVLPEIAHAGNPVDATPMADTAHLIEAVQIVAAAPEVDLLIVSAIPATPGLDILAPDPVGIHEENVFAMHSLPGELIRVSRLTRKPLVFAIDSGRLYDPSVLLLQRAGIPVYRKIDRASRALAMFASYRLGG
jgi:acyl-CoA synthetase (NDP forming)